MSCCLKTGKPSSSATASSDDGEPTSHSGLTVGESFFDSLWPLILKDNICDTHSKNTSEYFLPARPFDNIWAHTLLAGRGFKNYQKPIEMRCYFDETAEPLAETEEDEDPCELYGNRQIVPITRQVYQLLHEHEQRQKLAYDFVNRQFPWYMERPVYDADFELNDELREQFTVPFELSILQQIHTFQCKFLIIDAGADVGLRDMERWLKYRRYVQMIAVVRCKLLARRLLLFDGAFFTCLLEENLENTWQEELSHALETGVACAKELKLFENCGTPFVFVFSHKRGMCTCDTFKILRKF